VRRRPRSRGTAVNRRGVGPGDLSRSRSRRSIGCQRGPRSASTIRTTRMSRERRSSSRRFSSQSTRPGSRQGSVYLTRPSNSMATAASSNQVSTTATSRPPVRISTWRADGGRPEPVRRRRRRVSSADSARPSANSTARAAPAAPAQFRAEASALHVRLRGALGHECGVHRHHRILQGPLAGHVDQGARRRGDLDEPQARPVARPQWSLGQEVASAPAPGAWIGQPHRRVELPRNGQLPQPSRRRVADRGRRALEGQENGEAVDLMPPSARFVLGQLLTADVHATAQPRPVAACDEAPHLRLPVSGPARIGHREQPQLPVGRGAKQRVHPPSLGAATPRQARLRHICGRGVHPVRAPSSRCTAWTAAVARGRRRRSRTREHSGGGCR
jgi:hypothetical protein